MFQVVTNSLYAAISGDKYLMSFLKLYIYPDLLTSHLGVMRNAGQYDLIADLVTSIIGNPWNQTQFYIHGHAQNI